MEHNKLKRMCESKNETKHQNFNRRCSLNKSRHILFQELYYKYCMEYSEESFEEFYHSTFGFFLSFTRDRLSIHKGSALDPHEIVNRLYGVLVAHAYKKRKPIIKAILSWSFGVICNLIREEIREEKKWTSVEEGAVRDTATQTPLNQLLKSEEKEAHKGFCIKIIELIKQKNQLLSWRDRRVMEMFYLKRQKLKIISKELNLKVSHAAVILYRSRKKIERNFIYR